MKTEILSVDTYIQSFPQQVQEILEKVRAIILKTAPGSINSISYGMPCYKTNGKPLVYFAGYKSYVGFYAMPTGHSEFEKELSQYKQGKGSVQFPLDKEIPFELIEQIVAFRVKENDETRKY